MTFQTVIYTSKAAKRPTKASLQALAEISSRNNALIGVTGLLLYSSGTFFQLIEGNQAVLGRLYRRIESDRRHYAMRVLYKGSMVKRNFPEWCMGLLNLDDPWEKDSESKQLIERAFLIDHVLSDHERNIPLAMVREFIDQFGEQAA